MHIFEDSNKYKGGCLTKFAIYGKLDEKSGR